MQTELELNPFSYEKLSLVDKVFVDKPTMRVLEIGCGQGDFLAFLAKRHPNLHLSGIELVENDAHIAREKLKGVADIYIGDGESMPFEDHEFDCVIVPHVIEHVRDPEALLREVNRVLVDDGLLEVNTPNWLRTWNLLRKAIPGCHPRFRWPRKPGESLDSFRGHLREYTLKEIKSLISSCDFQIEKTLGIYPRFQKSGRFPFVKYFISRFLKIFGIDASDNIAVLAKKTLTPRQQNLWVHSGSSKSSNA